MIAVRQISTKTTQYTSLLFIFKFHLIITFSEKNQHYNGDGSDNNSEHLSEKFDFFLPHSPDLSLVIRGFTQVQLLSPNHFWIRPCTTQNSSKIYTTMGVNHGGTRGTRPPRIWNGGTLIQIVPPRFRRLLSDLNRERPT